MSAARYTSIAASALGFVILMIVAIVLGGLFGCPHYRVYEQRLAGEGKLREAESSRQILVEEARAKREAAGMLADAEVERAKGVAKANEIIGKSLQDNTAYLHWLWINELTQNPNAVIYIHTESNLPILEAGRRPVPREKGAP